MALNASYVRFGIDFGLLTIVIGHATFCIVVVYNNVIARLRRVSANLEEASSDLGADAWQTFRYVTFPQMRTALLAGGLLAFALSFDEVIVTTFTSGAEQTLPIWIFTNLARPEQLPIINVVALAVIVLSFIPVWIAVRLTREPTGVGGTAEQPPVPDTEIGSARIQEVSSMSVSVQKHKNLVGGEWVDASDGGTEEVINPATGETIAEVPKGTEADVDRAVEAAKKAWAEWRGVTPAERAELLLKLADVIDEHTDELAEIESRNVGQTVGGRAGRDAGLLRQHPLLRRRRPHPRGPLRGRVHAGLHVDDPPRADRDRRPGRAVELPADDGGLEVRTRARRGQRLDPQALGADAALDAALRGARRRRDPGRASST